MHYVSTNVSLHDEISMHDNDSTSIKIAPAALRSWRPTVAAVDRLYVAGSGGYLSQHREIDDRALSHLRLWWQRIAGLVAWSS
jgi:hypothetical protein